MTTLPKVAGKKPFYKELEKGRTYLWCSCGLSKSQSYCDGSHKDTDFLPIPYRAKVDGEEVLFCLCKLTSDGPHCDGSHNNLPGTYVNDDPESAESVSMRVRRRIDGFYLSLPGGVRAENR